MIDPRCKIGRVRVRVPANVVELENTTRLDIPASRVLARALERGLTEVVISGTDADGNEYYATNLASGPMALWLIRRLERVLLGQE